MIHSPRQRWYATLSAFLGSLTRASRTPRSRQRGLTFKLSTALFAVMAVLVGTAASAFANAANPLPTATGSATIVGGHVTQNADGTWHVDSGTVNVQVAGTWDWGTLGLPPGGKVSVQSDCSNRYGVGWAVDWSGLSNSPTASLPGSFGALQISSKQGGGYFHIFNNDMVASGDVYVFTDPCQQMDANGTGPTGPWSATHTYSSGQNIPQQLCVNVYDMHGDPNDATTGVGASLKSGDADPLGNHDNSIQTNDFRPAGASCFNPQFFSQRLIAHIYDCTNGKTQTEVPNGTVSASGPTTIASQANPMDDLTAQVGTYTVNAGAPAGYKFIACGGPAPGSDTSASQNVNVPQGGTGEVDFYVAAIPLNPNLTIHKSASVTQVTAGDSFTYRLDVANTGDGTANNAVVTDTIPAGLAIGTVTPSVGTCTTSGQNVTCNLGDLAKNATASITIAVTTSTAKCGTVTNTGSVKADNNATVDSNPVDVLIICPNPSLEITKSASATTVTVGDSFDYTLVVRSTGATAATGVVVTDDIPNGLTIVGTPTTTAGTCDAPSGQHVSCTVGDLAAANANTGTKSATITIHVTTTPAACGVVKNTGHASASNDGTADSNEVDVTVDCPITGDLVKTNNADGDTSYHQTETADLPGMDVPFRVVLTNTSAVPVVIDSIGDSWATDTGTLSIVPNCASVFVGQTVAPGDSITCDFTVAGYSPAAGTSLTNEATVVVHDSTNPNKTKTVKATSTVNTAATPPLSLTVLKTNDANGDNNFTKDESGAENANVNFRVSITNTSAVPVVIDSITDVWPGATEFAPACAASLVGTELAANGGTVSCDFSVDSYVPLASAGAKVNTVTVTAHQPGNPGNTTTQKDTSSVRGIAASSAVLGTTVVRALPRTGMSNTFGLAAVAIMLMVLGFGLVFFSGRLPQAALALRSSAATFAAPALYRSLFVVERRLGTVSRRKLKGR